MPTESKIILIDSNSLINRAFYALPPLTTNEGLFTNGIMGYISMLQRLISEQKPTHICAVFDCRAKTARHNKYELYKANRKGMPDELAIQVPILQELLEKMGIKVLFKEGEEADDIIGTLAKRFKNPTIIVSGDRDTLQLVDETTVVYNTKRGVSDVMIYNLESLLEEGFTPKQVIDYKGLAGDSSDNIPGAAGIGAKTAKTLLKTYNNIDNIYVNIENIKGKLKDRLIDSKDMVYLSKDLATINCYVDIHCTLDDIKFNYPLPIESRDLMQKLEFKNLLGRFEYNDDESTIKKLEIITEELQSAEEIRKVVESIPKNSKICILWDKDIILAYGNREYKIPVKYDLFNNGLTDIEVAELIKELYGEKYINIFFDAKNNFYILHQFDINAHMPYEDILLKAYLLNPNKVIKNLSQIMSDYGFPEINIAAEMLELNNILDENIKNKGLEKLYYEIELPLIECLYEMENAGFNLDKSIMDELSDSYTKKISELISDIYMIAGEEFNINSNKQLGDILYNKLGLTHGKKTKTGLSVSAEVLEELEHPIISKILEYRAATKLKSTYIDGMRSVMNKATNKVHTVFNQCLTVTGRLSSTEPNLQNIPVRREEGREIRKMFIASPGSILISADYSQIELRLMAHFSEEENLVNAFKHNQDIHTLTASKIFNVPQELIDTEMRSSAKAVNFGIIYGISSFGLAKNANVSNFQAKKFINEYFKEYPKVKSFMDNNVKLATKQGYLKTLMGRIRHFPELTSGKYNIKEFGKRAAMNMPLQGSASDIIKIAMLKVRNALKEKNLKAKLILQVHDELILDTPIEEEKIVREIVKNCMENAYSLNVPLIVNITSGNNWFEAK